MTTAPMTHTVRSVLLLWTALPGARTDIDSKFYISHPDIQKYFQFFGKDVNPQLWIEALMGFCYGFS